MILRNVFLFRLRSLWSTEDEQEESSKTIARAWLNFAYHGKPTNSSDSYNPQDPKWLVFGPERGQLTIESLKESPEWGLERMSFWVEAFASAATKIWANGRDEKYPDQPAYWPKIGDSK